MPKRRQRAMDSNLIGDSASARIGFYGTAPIARPSGANQGALTDSSGGTASLTIAAIGAAYSQTEVRNAVASLARSINQIRADLVALGLIKGSA